MNYDVLVLGSGPAGFYSALCCAKGGLKTALVEQSLTGGTGFSSGCLPVKIILDKIAAVKNTEEILFQTFPHVNSRQLYGQILKSMKTHSETVHNVEKERLDEAGVDFYLSRGSFIEKNRYIIDSGEIKAEKIIIATGSEAVPFSGVDFSHRVISHSQAVTLDEVPRVMTIIGGDVEGIEFASLFSHLGTQVSVIEQLPRILPGYDRDLVQLVIDRLEEKNVRINCSTKVLSIEENSDSVSIHTDKNICTTEKVLITGLRKSSFPEGLEKTGISTKDNVISVNNSFETSVPGIYAVGDVNGILGMAGTAIQQAVQLSDYLLSGQPFETDYSILPRAVFTIPSICGGGLQEKDISEKEEPHSIKIFPLDRTWRALQNGNNGFVKIIADSKGIIRGLWFVMDKADAHGAAIGLILKQELSLKQLKRELFVHPTIFESIFEAGLK